MKKFLKDNWKYILYGLGFIVLVVVLVKLSSESTTPSKKAEQQVETSSTKVRKEEEKGKEKVETATDSDETDSVEKLVYKYFDAMASNDVDTLKEILVQMEAEEVATVEKTSQYTEGYNNIVLYTKEGEEKGSYVVFASYEIKFVDVKTAAPGVLSFYIVTKDDGKYAIQNKLDDKMKAYIQNMVVEDKEVADLFEASQKRYEQALTDDAQLKEFVDGLGKKSTQVAKNEGEAQEQDTQKAENTQAPSPTETPEKKEEENKPDSTQEKTYVEAKENVNVRNDASETADRIGKLAGGETAEKTGEKDGWILINYKGQEGYVKGEFVKEAAKNDRFVSGTVNEGQEAAAETTDSSEAQTEAATATEEASESASTKKGTVRLKETANVRKGMSQESEKIGTAFVGDSYSMIEEYADGWTKIDYNGETGYIKSEFLE